jgi:hypothetical protein
MNPLANPRSNAKIFAKGAVNDWLAPIGDKTMESTAGARSSLFGLFRTLTSDTKTLIRQEIELAKTEISEKISLLGRNTVSLAIGGFVAYAGLIVLLIALGAFSAWAFTKAGLDPLLAGVTGLGAIGLVVVAIGLVMVLKAVKTFSKESLTPQRTLTTLQEIKGSSIPAAEEHWIEKEKPEDKPSSAELQGRVEHTETRLSGTLEEIGERLSPAHINNEVKARISAKPYQAGAIAMIAGLFSGWLIKRKINHA